MSRRPPSNSHSVNTPFAKKSRFDIDASVTEVKNMGTELLDALRAQKATLHWGHASCRDGNMANTTKAESLVSSCAQLEKKSKDASATVDKLFNALAKSELDTLFVELEMTVAREQGSGLAQIMILEGVLDYRYTIEPIVTKQVTEELKNMTADAVMANVKKVTKSAFKEVAKKQFHQVLELYAGQS